MAIRLVGIFSDQSKPAIRLRSIQDGTGKIVREYIANFEERSASIQLHEGSDPDAGFRSLQSWSMPESFDYAIAHTFEFRAMDDRLSIQVDGKEIGSVTNDANDEPGSCAVCLPEGALLNDIQWLPLHSASAATSHPK